MRAAVGVDTSGAANSALHMLARMAFKEIEIDLVHVVESVMPDGGFPKLAPTHPLSVMMEQYRQEGQSALDQAAAWCEAHGIAHRTFLLQGPAARTLIEHADKEGCQIVAVRSSQKGYYGSLFFGSVAKGLVIGARQSVLIVKGEVAGEGSLTCVLATDHSDYANACVDLLVDLAPSGIEKVVVLNADQARPALAGLPDPDLFRLGRGVCEKFAGKLGECVTRVIRETPQKAIAQTMQDEGADLLIMGAQGRGFFERVRIGSQSFHQVVNEPHSLFVLRLAKAPV